MTNEGPGRAIPSEASARLRTAYLAEVGAEVRRRLDFCAPCYLVALGLFIVVLDRRHPADDGLLRMLYAVATTVAVAAMLVTRRVAPRPVAAGAFTGFVIVLSAAFGIFGRPPQVVATSDICLLNGLAVLIPWGFGAQLSVALATLAGLVFVLPDHSLSTPVVDPVLTVTAGVATSLWCAAFLDRYRRQSFVRLTLFTEAKRRAEEEAEIAAVLVRVGETLHVHLDQADLLERVNGLAVDALRCDWSATFAWDDERAAYRLRAAVGLADAVLAELRELEMNPATLSVAPFLHPGELVEIPDATRKTFIPGELMTRWQAASTLIVPIAAGDKITAVMTHGYRERTGAFSVVQRRIALGIGHATAIALENARLIATLQAASRIKSEFVATMSHELRTPLNIITGYTELLSEETFGPLTAEQQETLGRMRQSAHELLALIDETLNLGRLEAGRTPLTIEPVDLEGVFAEVRAEVHALVPAGVTLTWSNALDRAAVLTDRGKVKTILKNLVGNALKFTTAGSVAVSAATVGDGVRLVVRDTGIGMAAEHLSVIFEMFRQLDGSSTRRFGGVGLGLHIVKRLVEMLGGTIAVESAPGRGSTFAVMLPQWRSGRAAAA
jgi:signal transduction histidine kinase